jgi:hypothetical protein
LHYPHIQHILDIVAWVVLISSVLTSILPPYEVFSFAPRFQTVYRIVGTFIGTIGALNLRSLTMKLYPSYKGGNSDSTTTSPSNTKGAS